MKFSVHENIKGGENALCVRMMLISIMVVLNT